MSEKKKSKVEESVEENKSKSKVESKAESKVESKVEKKDSNEDEEKKTKQKSKVEESAKVQKVDIDATDPLKDKERMKILKKLISHLCLLIIVLAIKNICMALIAHYFYRGKTHLVIFGALCIMQLIGAPIGWLAIKYGNRVLFLCCSIINVIWMICVIILLLYYWLIAGGPEFNNEIALHVGAIFFMAAAIALAILCFLMMQQIDMINIQYKKPEVYIATEGKASDKAKLKKVSKA